MATRIIWSKCRHNHTECQCGTFHPIEIEIEEVISDKTNPKDLLGVKKVPFRFVPPIIMIYASKVFELGAKKYGQMNWREKDVRLSIYIEAAQRHLFAMQDGEFVDKESDMPHAAHVIACMGIILDADSLNKLVNDLPISGKAAIVMDLLDRSKKE
jgi:hypothetical protein